MKKTRGSTTKTDDLSTLDKWIDDLSAQEAKVAGDKKFVDALMKSAKVEAGRNRDSARKKSNGATGGLLKSLDPVIRKIANTVIAETKKAVTKNTRAIKLMGESVGKIRKDISTMGKNMRMLLEDRQKTRDALKKSGFKNLHDLMIKFNKFKKDAGEQIVKLAVQVSVLEKKIASLGSASGESQLPSGVKQNKIEEDAAATAGLGSLGSAGTKLITDVANKAVKTAVSMATSNISGLGGGTGGGGGFVEADYKQDKEFTVELNRVAAKYNIDANDLLAVMYSESGVNPQAVNPGSGASGLIQFIPSTAKGLGTSVEALRKMSRAEQMKYVDAYFASVNLPKGASGGQIYASVFLPAFVNKPVLATKGDPYYNANQGLDLDGDGKITMKDMDARVAQMRSKHGLGSAGKNDSKGEKKESGSEGDDKSSPDATRTSSSPSPSAPMAIEKGGPVGGSDQTAPAPGPQKPGTAPDVSSKEKPTPGAAGQMVTLTTPKSKRSYTVASDVAEKFKGFVDELENSGYQIKDIGGYRGGAGQMWHGKGYAIDINPSDNPMYKKLPDGGLQDQVTGRKLAPQEAEKLKSSRYPKFGYGKDNFPANISQMAAKWGLGWGGNWQSSVDTMHFSAGGNEGGSGTLASSDGGGGAPAAIPSQGGKPSIAGAESSQSLFDMVSAVKSAGPTPAAGGIGRAMGGMPIPAGPPNVGSGIPTAMGSLSRLPGLGSIAGILSTVAVGGAGSAVTPSIIPAAVDMLSQMTGMRGMSTMANIPMPGQRGFSIPTMMGEMTRVPGIAPSSGIASSMMTSPRTVVPQSPNDMLGLVGTLMNAVSTISRGNDSTRAPNQTYAQDQYQDNRVPPAMPSASILRDVFGMDIPTVYQP